MSKDLTIIVLGLWVAVMPFLGFPGFWEMVIFVISGLAIAAITFMLRREVGNADGETTNTVPDVYTQNGAYSGRTQSTHAKEISTKTNKH